MGLQDAVKAKYVGRNDIFADVFNYYIYGGEQVIGCPATTKKPAAMSICQAS